jgi:hypothetical protein
MKLKINKNRTLPKKSVIKDVFLKELLDKVFSFSNLYENSKKEISFFNLT